MGYIEKNRLPNEELIVKAEHHVAAFIGPSIPIIIAIALVSMDGFFVVLGILFLLIGIWRAIKTTVVFMTNEMALTDKRMIGKSGFIRRDSLDVRNDFVSGLMVNQSILGRVLNYGTVVVQGGGSDVGFNYIKEPQKLRNAVQEYLSG